MMMMMNANDWERNCRPSRKLWQPFTWFMTISPAACRDQPWP